MRPRILIYDREHDRAGLLSEAAAQDRAGEARALAKEEDIIEVRPEMLALLESCNSSMKKESKGCARAPSRLKSNVKKRRSTAPVGP